MMEEAKALPKCCRQVGSAFTSFIQATRVPARVVQSNFGKPGSACCAFLFLLIFLISLLFLARRCVLSSRGEVSRRGVNRQPL